MEADLAQSSSASKPVPAQQYVVDIDLNAPPPPDQDILEEERQFAQIRSIGRVEDESVGDDEDSDDSDEDEEFLDVDNMSYEELLALGERIGKQSRGLHPDKISALPCHTFLQPVESECVICVICRYDIEDGASFLTLPCNHLYHSECIKSWLQIQKNCPICNAEVTP